MKSVIITFILITLVMPLLAQTSFFEDSKGESAYKMYDRKVIVNTGNESIVLGFDSLRRTGASTFTRMGLALKINASEGVANIKNENGFLIDGQLTGYLRFKRASFASGRVNEYYIGGTLLADRNKLFNSEKAVSTRQDFGWKVELGRMGYWGNLLYGLSVNFRNGNNIGDLPAFKVSKVQVIGDSIIVGREQTAYDLASYLSDKQTANVNGDVAYLLNRVGVTNHSRVPVYLSLHLRGKYEENSSIVNTGIGLFFGETPGPIANRNPRRLVGGINLELNDAFNDGNSDDSSWDRTTINLVAGFKVF